MRKKNKKVSLMKTWTISYALIMMIPLIAALLISFEYEKNMNRQLTSNGNYITEHLSYNFKNAMIDIRKLYHEISLNENIKDVSSISSSADYFKSKKVYNFIEDMKSYGIYKDDILSYYIYFDRTDSIISETGIVDSRYFYDVYLKNNSSYEEWKELQTRENAGNYYPIKFSNNGFTHDAISITMSVVGLPDTIVSILVDKNVVFRNLTESKQINPHEIYVFDNYGNLLICHSDNTDNIPQTINDLPKASSSVFVKTADISYDTVNMKLATVIKKEEIASNITNMRFFSTFLILFGLIVSIVMIRYYSKLNYQPINEILKIFGVSEKKDEYNVIRSSIEAILNENKTLVNDYEKQNVTLKLWFLSRILRGADDKNYSLEDYKKYGISFKDGEYAVMALYFDDLTGLFNEEPDYDSDKKYDILKFIVTNVFEELFGTKNSAGYVLDIDNIMFCVINVYNETESCREFIRKTAEYGVEFIKTHFNADISFSVSELHDTPQNLHTAYTEALHTMAYKNIMNISASIMYSDIQKTSGSDYPFTLEEEHKLINYLRTANEDGAKALINKMFDNVCNNHSLPLEYASCLIFDITASILKLPDDSSGITQSLLKSIGTCDILLNYSKMDALKKEIMNTVTELCNGMKNDSKANCYPYKIIEYIEENYVDINLCRASIASHFGLTPSYIAKIFKDAYGEPLVDYINKYRLMKAKEFISTGRYTFSEVSQMVGYDQIRTFNRVFKKYENITPSEYKSLEHKKTKETD